MYPGLGRPLPQDPDLVENLPMADLGGGRPVNPPPLPPRADLGGEMDLPAQLVPVLVHLLSARRGPGEETISLNLRSLKIVPGEENPPVVSLGRGKTEGLALLPVAPGLSLGRGKEQMPDARTASLLRLVNLPVSGEMRAELNPPALLVLELNLPALPVPELAEVSLGKEEQGMKEEGVTQDALKAVEVNPGKREMTEEGVMEGALKAVGVNPGKGEERKAGEGTEDALVHLEVRNLGRGEEMTVIEAKPGRVEVLRSLGRRKEVLDAELAVDKEVDVVPVVREESLGRKKKEQEVASQRAGSLKNVD
jgi:hypothetical protein